MTKKKTITVKGKGFACASPDYIQIDIELSATKDTYEKAITDSAKRLEGIRTALATLDFDKKTIKTAAFHIDAEYDYPQNSEGNPQRRLVGYQYQHQLHVEFLNDSELLGKVLQELSNSNMEPEFSVRFKLKEQTQIQKLMLEDAVRDARNKALILTKASGVKLDSIESIQYDWNEMELYSSANFIHNKQMRRVELSTMDLQPEDIENSDIVTITWVLSDE